MPVNFPYKFYRLLRSARNDVVTLKYCMRHCKRSEAIHNNFYRSVSNINYFI